MVSAGPGVMPAILKFASEHWFSQSVHTGSLPG